MFRILTIVRCATLLSISTWLELISHNAEFGFASAQKTPAEVYSQSNGRRLARATAAPSIGSIPECPADRYERAEAKAFEDLAFSLQHPPLALVEERAKELAAVATTATMGGRSSYNSSMHAGLFAGSGGGAGLAALLHPGGCCNPSSMNVHEAVSTTLLLTPTSPAFCLK